MDAPAAPVATPGAPAPPAWPRLDVRSATLGNGLQVLVLERHASPTVAFNLHFQIGTVDERHGTLGLSHMLEHLLFKGTPHLGSKDYAREAPILEEIDRVGADIDRERARGEAAGAARLERLEKRLAELGERQRRLVVKDELTDILNRAGADTVNASTWPDATNYFSVLPAARAEVWLAVFGEQMRRPVMREFYTEREVVMEERRMRVEDDPTGSLIELAGATTFLAHPYRNSDWMPELRRLSRADAMRHYETYYGAGNAVLAVAGDVRLESLLPLIEKHFGKLPRRAPPPEVAAVEPPQQGERRALLEFDARPQMVLAYHIPGLSHAHEPALAIVSAVLSGHGTATAFESGLFEYPGARRWSRLHRRLVEERGVAQSIFSGGNPGDRFPRALTVLAEPRAPHTLEDLERALLEEIEGLAERPPDGAEIERARANLRASYLRQLESNFGAAWLLGFTHSVTGDWRTLERYVAALDAVGAEEVAAAARAYLRPRNRTVVWRVPAQGQGGAEDGS